MDISGSHLRFQLNILWHSNRTHDFLFWSYWVEIVLEIFVLQLTENFQLSCSATHLVNFMVQ